VGFAGGDQNRYFRLGTFRSYALIGASEVQEQKTIRKTSRWSKSNTPSMVWARTFCRITETKKPRVIRALSYKYGEGDDTIYRVFSPFKPSWPIMISVSFSLSMYFTGDGARRDEDGYYWITGRLDDVPNVSGHRMGTAEIESAFGISQGLQPSNSWQQFAAFLYCGKIYE
jgi:acyl-CoA synthetase (AMP-forming)/AMP-acid ligase II